MAAAQLRTAAGRQLCGQIFACATLHGVIRLQRADFSKKRVTPLIPPPNSVHHGRLKEQLSHVHVLVDLQFVAACEDFVCVCVCFCVSSEN